MDTQVYVVYDVELTTKDEVEFELAKYGLVVAEWVEEDPERDAGLTVQGSFEQQLKWYRQTSFQVEMY